LHETFSLHKELAGKLKELEAKVTNHDADIQEIFNTIKKLITNPIEPPRKRIGFMPP
jgi:hypothetical protein